MTLFEEGRLCVKIAGRDSGLKCVVVEQLDNTYVIVDGSTRRKKVNIKHLEPLAEIIKIKKGASHAEVAKAFEKLGFSVWETNAKTPTTRPRRQRTVKVHAAPGKESAKKVKVTPKKEGEKVLAKK